MGAGVGGAGRRAGLHARRGALAAAGAALRARGRFGDVDRRGRGGRGERVRADAGRLAAVEPGDHAVAEGVDEQPVVVARRRAVVVRRMPTRSATNSSSRLADDGGDRLLGLERRPASGRCRRRTTQCILAVARPSCAEHRLDLVGLGESSQSRSASYGDSSLDDLKPTPSSVGLAEQRVGVGLQRPLGDHGAVALVLEVVARLRRRRRRGWARRRCPASSTARRRSPAPGCSPSRAALYAGSPALPMPKPGCARRRP